MLFVNEDETPAAVKEPVKLKDPFEFIEPEARIDPDTTAAPETNKATVGVPDIAVFTTRRAGSADILLLNEDEIPFTVSEPVINASCLNGLTNDAVCAYEALKAYDADVAFVIDPANVPLNEPV